MATELVFNTHLLGIHYAPCCVLGTRGTQQIVSALPDLQLVAEPGPPATLWELWGYGAFTQNEMGPSEAEPKGSSSGN